MAPTGEQLRYTPFVEFVERFFMAAGREDWLINGFERAIQRALEVDKKTDNDRRQINEFEIRRVMLALRSRVSVDDVHAAYTEWCRVKNWKPVEPDRYAALTLRVVTYEGGTQWMLDVALSG